MTYHWDFHDVFVNWWALAVGVAGTLRLFVVCLILGMSLGLLIALGRRSRSVPIRWLSTVFMEFFRNTPVLVQILWFYYALPILTSVEISPFMAAILGISLNSAAYSAEIYRGGIQSIEPGQWEASKAIGMSSLQALRRIEVCVDVVELPLGRHQQEIRGGVEPARQQRERDCRRSEEANGRRAVHWAEHRRVLSGRVCV